MNDVITIGDAMITFDPSTTGPMRHVSSFTRKVGGAELNVAIGCARLGLKTGWISRLGKDEFGRHIYNFTRGEGIDVSEVELMEGFPTSLNFKEIGADGSGKTFYYRHQSPTSTLTAESLNEDYFRNARLLHITGVFPAVSDKNIEVIDAAISLAEKHGVKIALDPNIRLKLWSEDKARTTLLNWMPYVDYLLTGLDEAELLFGTREIGEITEHAKKYGLSHLFLKLGAEGSMVWTQGELIEKPAEEVEMIADTVGAGDGFDAGVIYGLLNDWNSERILTFANKIGSMVVGVYGDNEGLPYMDEVLEKLGEKTLIER
ncbi:sugar kinase [Halobacillus litoralis]|uniref:2-keto-3-deoxygluconate kinase n=1 Tax=Halobacillus litoralis TaxID=45668 RepID=A0A410ME75_9BACI|nr:sugar kinase [Halobacillus litoralis]QAS52965.1 2-keto-3-deoxygluconate kinase [Halobacillus litoralis]